MSTVSESLVAETLGFIICESQGKLGFHMSKDSDTRFVCRLGLAHYPPAISSKLAKQLEELSQKKTSQATTTIANLDPGMGGGLVFQANNNYVGLKWK
jgi:hypothetical protein